MSAPLRVIFMGTPDFAARALQSLINSSHEIIAVYTQPPRPKGRGQQIQQSPVHRLAEENGIPVFTPKNFKNAQDIEQFHAHQADVAVVAAYGLILPTGILSAPKHGCVNIHASLLPRWRGAAPIQRAILAGDEQTGISLMQMDAGLDTGAVIAMHSIPIGSQDNTASLHDKLAALGAQMIVQTLDDLAKTGSLRTQPQLADGVTYAEKISKEMMKLDWTLDAWILDRHVRAFSPNAWCFLPDGRRLKVITARPVVIEAVPGEVINDQGDIGCGRAALRLEVVQPEGKKAMEATAAIHGGYLKPGDVLR